MAQFANYFPQQLMADQCALVGEPIWRDWSIHNGSFAGSADGICWSNFEFGLAATLPSTRTSPTVLLSASGQVDDADWKSFVAAKELVHQALDRPPSGRKAPSAKSFWQAVLEIFADDDVVRWLDSSELPSIIDGQHQVWGTQHVYISARARRDSLSEFRQSLGDDFVNDRQFLDYVRETFQEILTVRVRVRFRSGLGGAPSFISSTHDWVHRHQINTGVSPPTGAPWPCPAAPRPVPKMERPYGLHRRSPPRGDSDDARLFRPSSRPMQLSLPRTPVTLGRPRLVGRRSLHSDRRSAGWPLCRPGTRKMGDRFRMAARFGGPQPCPSTCLRRHVR